MKILFQVQSLLTMYTKGTKSYKQIVLELILSHHMKIKRKHALSFTFWQFYVFFNNT